MVFRASDFYGMVSAFVQRFCHISMDMWQPLGWYQGFAAFYSEYEM